MRFDATDEDINKRYRQISLQVHPDKCTHPRAKEAFEVLGDARKLLNDEDKRRDLSATLQFVKGEMLKEWRKEHRHDSAAKLLAQASGTVRARAPAAARPTRASGAARRRRRRCSRRW